ncbi:MAG: RNA-binding protein [Thermoplasmata archaeon]|nr:MAG: RNA-binding protein [Thermoplasmata archaeon]
MPNIIFAMLFIIMKNLDDIANAIEKKLNEKDDLREIALKKCRDIIRESRKSIKKLHNGDVENAAKRLEKAIKLLRELKEKLKDHPDLITTGYMENAMQEVAEGKIFLAIVKNEELPYPEDIEVSYTAYVMGLADVIGELRRRGMYKLKEGNVAEVEEIVDAMEAIYDRIAEFDYPSGLIPLKRKQDIMKKVLEKMREEIVIFRKSKELENKIDALLNKLKKEKEEVGLDIDSLL